MTRAANARIAGFTYLFYAAIGICLQLLMHRATSVDGNAPTIARIGEHATDVRMAILITLLECFSALVLAVALYRDHAGPGPRACRCFDSRRRVNFS